MAVIDNLLLNLKIISKIPENGRLKRSELNIMALEEPITRVTWIKRYLNGDSRSRTILDITNVIDHVIDKCNDILNSKYFVDHGKFNMNSSFIDNKIESEYIKQYELLEEIYKELKESIKGLINLKITYYSDDTIISKIDILLSKINYYIIDLEKKVFIS